MMATGSVRPADYTLDAFPTGAGFTAVTGTASSVLETVDRSGTPTFRFDFGSDVTGTLRGFKFDPVGTADDVEFFVTFRQSATNPDSKFPTFFRGAYTSDTDFDMYIGPLDIVGSGTAESDWRKRVIAYVSGSNSGIVGENLNSASSRLWDAGVVYNMRVRLSWDGSTNTISHRTWLAGGTEPSGWDSVGLDSQLSPGGFHGFGLTKSSSTFFDLDYVGWATAGDSAPSPSESSSATDPPSGFTFVAASGSRQVDGSWDAVSGASGYDWEVEEDVASVWTSVASGNTASTSFQLTSADGVDWSTTYRARVRTRS